MTCVSTWTLTARLQGLCAAVDELKSLAPRSLFVEAVEPLPDAKAGFEAIVARGVPILGVELPLEAPPTKDGRLRTIDDPEESAWSQTLGVIEAWRPRFAAAKVEKVVLEVGNGGETPHAKARDRERTVDRCCRRLFDLARLEPGLQWLLRTPAAPGSVLDAESSEWICDALRTHRVGLALDLGRLHLQEQRGNGRMVDVVDRLGRWAALLFVTDGDGKERTRLLPGMGTVSWSSLRKVLPRQIPWVIAADPALPLALLSGALEVLRDSVAWTQAS